MADDLKPPVAIRITRPYTTEAEFLEREFDTLTHTSVVLLGAQPRPQGVVLRFEIVLTTGESLHRGEGRVVGYKETAHGGEPGLSLRFTRLDARSKTVVDRASALREARVRAATSLPARPAGEAPPEPPPPPPPAPFVPPVRQASRRPPPLPDWAKEAPIAPSVPAVATPIDIETTQVDPKFDLTPPPDLPPAPVTPQPPPPPRVPIRPTPARPPPLPRMLTPLTSGSAAAPVTSAAPAETLESSSSAAPPQFQSAPTALEAAVSPAPAAVARFAPRSHAAASRSRNGRDPGPLAAPANRDALLAKLRTRAQALPPERVREILAKSP